MDRDHWFRMSATQVLLCLLLAQVGADWTATCPSTCTCKWNSGKKVAECINTNFTTVPENLSPDIQVLDLRGTPLQVLVDHAFRSAGLVNLQRIHLRNCSLREVKKNAFDELSIMIEVDLSNNQLTRIHPETFANNERLRSINLSNNPLHKLEAHQFPVLPQLRTLELVNCGLELLDKKAFMHLSALETLKLSDNRFTMLKPEVFLPLSKLRSLDLQGNPWICDCKLLPLWDFLSEANLNSVVTMCRDPKEVTGRLWGQLTKEDLACRPTVEITDRWFEGRLGFDAIFSCRVSGTPPPVVWWVLQNKISANATLMSSSSDQFIIRESVIAPVRPYEEAQHWSNLTLRRVTEQDAGEYRCVARNTGGQSEINATLTIPPAPVIIIVEEDNAIPHTIVIGVAGAVTVVLVSGLLFLVVCICRRHKRRTRRETQLPNGLKVANGNGTIGCKDTEQEKSLLVIEMDDFNKRPKNGDGYEAVSQTEVDSDGLARGSCTYIPGEKFDDRVPDTGRDLSMNSIRDPNNSQVNPDGSFYPDLLDIPHRARGGSPSSASGASTAPDTSRLLMPLNPAQLAGHPSYASADYRTMPIGLPYHTPLHFTDSMSSTASSGTVLLPAGNRPGYVTLPRRPRPRVPSWASNPVASPSPTIDRQQPLYDTIGPRITADGSSSSALSLNKIAGLAPVAAPSPSCSIRSNPTPTRGHKISLPAYYVPIEEVDIPPPSPLVPREGRSSTLPLSTPNIADSDRYEGRRPEPTLPYLSSPNRSADDESSPLTTSTPNSNASHTSPEILSPIVDLRTAGNRASVSSITSTGSRTNNNSPRKKIPPIVAPKPVGLPKSRPVSVGGQRNSFAEAQLDSYNKEKSTSGPVKVPPKPPPKPKKRISTAEGDGSRLTETDSIFEDEGEDGTEV